LLILHGVSLLIHRLGHDGFEDSKTSELTTLQLKRKRAAGANSRFDRMIEEVDMIHHTSARPARRRRLYSSGSSSISSHDIPKTPLDAYSVLPEGRLGKDFTVIKMRDPLNKTTTNSTHERSSEVGNSSPLHHINVAQVGNLHDDVQ